MLGVTRNSPVVVLIAGAGLSVGLLAAGVIGGQGEWSGAAGLVLRALHVFAAMVWVGLIVFVNFIQLAVLGEAGDGDRAAVMRTIVPRTARSFRLAANVTVVSGLVLLLMLGYVTERPPQQAKWMWLGAALGIAMLAFVHARISPAIRALIDPGNGDGASKGAARETVRFYARVNLLLSGPVTLAMVAAAHG